MDSNFYIGGEEYIVIFKNGIHHIINVNAYEREMDMEYPGAVVFSGSYDECISKRDEMEIEYQESRF